MKKIINIGVKIVATLLGAIIIYILAGLLLPLIPVNEKPTTEPKNIEIFLLTNGIHTDIVMPIKNEIVDWSKDIPFDNIRSKSNDFNYLAIGWGDKGFYLDTPTWADLKASTAIKAAFWLGESAMHCTYYKEINQNTGEDYRKIMITEQQYRDLVQYIKNGFDRDKNGNFILIPTDAVYGDNDAFYEAKESYNFTKTCNTWVNTALKIAGQKAAVWTATDKGIFRHYN